MTVKSGKEQDISSRPIDHHVNIALHPCLNKTSRAVLLNDALESLGSGKKLSIDKALIASVVLAEYIAVPPAIDVDLFWKCISSGLTLIELLNTSGSKHQSELLCLQGKLNDALTEAIFSRPEEITLKSCIERVGPKAAALADSVKFCHDLLVKIVASACLVAKFERKTAAEVYSKAGLALMKSVIKLDFPSPIDQSLGLVITDALSQSLGELASFLPLILLQSIVGNDGDKMKIALGVFVPVVKFTSNASFNLERREAVDNLCWQILTKTLVTNADMIMADESGCHSFSVALTDFLGSQRASFIEPHLNEMCVFCIRYQCESALMAICKTFLNANRPEFILSALLKKDLIEENDWLVPFLGKWLATSFSLTTPSFPAVWQFFLSQCLHKESAQSDASVLWCFHYFLSGLQAFGSQETVLPTVKENFSKLCVETASLFADESFVEVTAVAQESAIPALNCVVSLTILISVGEMESVGEVKENLHAQSKAMRKLLKKILKKCMAYAKGNNEHILNALLALCHLKPDEAENVEKLKSFLADLSPKETFDLTPAINFCLKNSEDNAVAQSKEAIFGLLDCWLSSATKFNFPGQHLISSMCFLEKRQSLDEFLSSKKSATRQEAILSVLSLPKTLHLLTSLPAAVREQLLSSALKKLDNQDESHAEEKCPLKLVTQLVKKEAIFQSYNVFSNCSVSSFMEILERHYDCCPAGVLNLAKIACNVATSNETTFAQMTKFLAKRLKSQKASIVVCQCLFTFSRKTRTLRYQEPYQKLFSSLGEEKEKFSLSKEFCDSSAQEKDSKQRWSVLAVCLISLMDWPQFGRNSLTLDEIAAICEVASSIDVEGEANMWSTVLIELLSKCLKSDSQDFKLFVKAVEILLSDAVVKFDTSSPAFVTVWQNLFRIAGDEAGQLLRHVVFVHLEVVVSQKTDEDIVKTFGPVFAGYLKTLIASCDKEEHGEDDHENAVWNDGDKTNNCRACDLMLALYENVNAHPVIGVLCLPIAAQHGFFDSKTRGLFSFDLLLAIAVASARSPSFLAASPLHYTAYCSLLTSLLRLRGVQQESESLPIRLTNILHIVLFCLSTAFTCLLEFSLPQNDIATYFQELGKLIAIVSRRRRLLADSAVHVVAATFVAAVRSPPPAGFAGLSPIYRKQLVAVVVQLFQMCSERALKSMALFLPPECLPLLKSVRSEAFVQKKARRKV